MDTVCKRIIYRGRVQGVGFRYTTATLARRFPVTGFVKNLPDGSVEVVVSGGSATVRDFLDELESAFSGHIQDRQEEDQPGGEGFSRFDIRY